MAMGRRKRARDWSGRNVSGRRTDREVCRKRGFTREEAERELERFRARDTGAGLERLPTRVQECEACGAFHITGVISKPAKAGKMRRRRQGGMGWK
ncbi:Uncharacterised protein [Mycobacterium tuberculosis]|nr:Uncharacterised protein [Mycobacterium tuberculosis]